MAILDEIIELKKTSKITESVFLTKKELNRLNREGTSTYNFGDRVLDMNIIEAREIVSDEEIKDITDALAKYEAYRKLIEEGETMKSKIGKEVVDILNEKIIMIYNNIEELKEILTLIEENSNYRWCDGREYPTEYIPTDNSEGYINLTSMGLQHGVNKPNEYLYQMKDKYEFSNLKEEYNEK